MTEPFPAPIETDRLRLERLAPDAVDVNALYRSFWTTDHADAVFEYVPQTAHAHPFDRRDGVVRNHQPRGDVVDDVVHYSISRENWASNRPDGLEVDLDA